jgi:hypothetical protein
MISPILKWYVSAPSLLWCITKSSLFGIQFFQSPSLFTRLPTRSDRIDGPFHTNANGTAAITHERDETHRQLAESHDVLAAQLAEFRAAMDVQSTLLKRILEREGGSGSER